MLWPLWIAAISVFTFFPQFEVASRGIYAARGSEGDVSNGSFGESISIANCSS
jgi:hypothetical protein